MRSGATTTGADAGDRDSFSELEGSAASLLRELGRAPAVPLSAAKPPPLPEGTIVGERFEIVGRLGAGGTAVVYLARDRQLGRRVAIKVHDRPPDPRGLARALREAKAMARLSHPHVLTVHEVGVVDERMYIATEYVDGWNAREWLAAERPGRRAIVDLYLRAGEGLAAAHAVGIVHRDFKPDNVLVGRDGRVRVADFGLARVGDEGPEPGGSAVEVTADGAALTEDGAIAGTPAYMAPEQRRGQPVDARADQFAFCVALYEALTGRRPSEDLWDMSSEALERAGLPAWIDRALRRGLEREPSRRFPTLAALLAELRRDPQAERRRWAGRGALALALGVSLAGAAGALQGPPLCADASAPLTGVWDAARREQVAAAFERACAEGCPDESFARAAGQLDAYAGAWTRARQEGCEATRVHGVQSGELLDRRMACLDGRLRQLAALVEVLADADAAVVEAAPRAAASLPALGPCADAAHLMARLPPPDDPQLALSVERARARLAAAEALWRASKHSDAIAAAEELLGEAASLGHPPLRAELALALGEMLWQDDPGASEAHLEDAYFTARTSEHDEVAAKAAIGLVWTVGYVQRRTAAAELWVRHALAETGRRGASDSTRAQALGAAGSLRAEQGRHAEALALHDQALALLADDPRGLMWTTVENNRAATLDALGRYEEARAAYERVLDNERAIFGPLQPRVAATRSNLGLVLMRQGRLAEAAEEHSRALEILAALRGPEHDSRWLALLNLGIALTELDRGAEATSRLEEALAIVVRLYGPEHPDVALCLSALANALKRSGRHEEAIARAREGLAITERAYGAAHPEVATQAGIAADALVAAGRVEEALPLFAQAIAVWDGRGESEHPSLAEVLVEQGEALRLAGRRGDAERSFARALAIAERGEVAAAVVADARAGLAALAR